MNRVGEWCAFQLCSAVASGRKYGRDRRLGDLAGGVGDWGGMLGGVGVGLGGMAGGVGSAVGGGVWAWLVWLLGGVTPIYGGGVVLVWLGMVVCVPDHECAGWRILNTILFSLSMDKKTWETCWCCRW
jgi:hypothetical protein